MTTFANQTIGSYDDKTNEFVEIWWDETLLKAFAFHSIGVHSGSGAYHGVYGVTVEARYIWQAITAFANSQVMAVRQDDSRFYVTWVMLADRKTEELRMSNKYGQAVARMRRTGYVQPAPVGG